MEDTAKEGVVSAIQSMEDAVGVGGVTSSVVCGATGGNEKVGLIRERTRISVSVCVCVCVCVCVWRRKGCSVCGSKCVISAQHMCMC